MADDDDFNDPIDDDVADFDDGDEGVVEDFTDDGSEKNEGNEQKKDQKNESVASSSSASRGVSYRVLDESSLDDRLRRFLSDMTALLDMPTEEISILFRIHQWNKERLMAAYSDKPTETLSAAGLESYDENNSGWNNLSVPSIDCSICDDTVQKEKAFALPCKHAFCNDCWRSYLNDKMANGRSVITTRCPYYQCTTAVPDSVFQRFLDPSSYSRYHRYILRSFVEDNKSMRWCPAPQCSHAIEAIDRTINTVTCVCKQTFCFQCGSEESHRPITCHQLARWKEKCGSESETAQWMIANTRKCPKCHVRIEKNSGCNHMTCRANGCKYEFCWVCNGPWSDHGSETGGFYKCNKFSAKAALARGDGTSVLSEDERQQETNRYLFYYQRYHNHEQSKKFAERQREATERRMNELHSAKSSMLWIDVKYLAEATHAVFQCRQVLKYTYVFAYYLPEGREKTLFEFLQQKLEQATEKLSEMSELPIESQDKLQITNYMRVTLQFMNNLLDGVANGLTS